MLRESARAFNAACDRPFETRNPQCDCTALPEPQAELRASALRKPSQMPCAHRSRIDAVMKARQYRPRRVPLPQEGHASLG
jgi:hypothetical protein